MFVIASFDRPGFTGGGGDTCLSLMVIEVIWAIQDAPLAPGNTSLRPSERVWPSFS